MTTSTQTFTSSGTFTAPATLINGGVSIAAYGAPGGGASGSGRGGYGARVAGTLAMSPAGTLAITVGSVGSGATGGAGYHAAGNGAAGHAFGTAGFGGGGSSAVVQSSTLMIEAGGGGGQGGNGTTSYGYGGTGGAGGLIAGAGSTGGQESSGESGHGGNGANNATNGGGGTYGVGISSHGTAGSAGSAGVGGAGGAADASSTNSCGGGGGGGGGYGGGGGGGGGSNTGAGGGGGGASCYVNAGVGSAVTTSGASTKYGSVAVTYTTADVPYAPTLKTPANGSYAELATTPTFTFEYEPGTDSGALSTWAMRRKLSSGSTYNYWNASAANWTATTPVWNAASYLTLVSGTPGVTACEYSYAFPSASWTDGNTYNWSIACAEANYPSINQGPFATDATVIASAMPTVVINNPSASEVVTLQTVPAAWTTSPGSGLSQTAYRLIIYSAAQQAASTFASGYGPYLYDSGVVSSAASSQIIAANAPNPELAGGDTYWLYIQVTETGGQTSTWVGQEFSIQFDGPATPALQVFMSNDPTTGAPYNELIATVVLNAIGANDSSFESNSTGSYTVSNGALAVSSAWSADGTYSLQCTSSAAGTTVVLSASGLSGYPCQAGESLTVIATLQAPSAVFTTTPVLQFYNSSGTAIGSPVGVGSGVSPATTGTTTFGTVTAPAGAAFYAVGFSYATTGSQIVRADQIAVYHGNIASPVWSLGGFFNQATTTFEFQYSDDGVNWTDCRLGASVAIPNWPATGSATISDYEATPGAEARQYRVRCNGFSGIPSVNAIVPGLWSDPLADAPTTTNGLVFIQDPLNPGTAVGCTLASDWKPTIPEKMQRYWPIGRPFGVKSTDGTKGIGGSVQLQVDSQANRLALESLLAGEQTLLLQFPNEQYYISIDGDRAGTVTWATMGTLYSDYELSSVTVPYVQAETP